jgi:hypothetical protein
MSPPPDRAVGAPPGGEPFLPEAGMVYWVETTILPPADAEWRRPVVVLAPPETVNGTVTVVARSGTDDFGVEHPADPDLGLSRPGRFSRRHPVQGRLWTRRDVAPIGPLDDAVFAAVVARFTP